MSELISFTQKLLRCNSVTPKHAGSLDLIQSFCTDLSAHCIRIDRNETANLFVYFGSTKHIPLLFCGHVDVVPAGDDSDWIYPPFSATIADACIYGRGAVDMKSSIAAFLLSLRALHEQGKDLGQIALLITSDEEGSGKDGTKYALNKLHQDGFRFKYGLVGEPTSTNTIGDTIKIGRRGSLSATIAVTGKQGHVAYAHLAKNPVHIANNLLQKILSHPWACNVPHFPATQCVCMQISADNIALNVIPQRCWFSVNFRYSPSYTHQQLQNIINDLLAPYTKYIDINWQHSAEPFYSPPAQFAATCINAIQTYNPSTVNISTDGGTSDARFVVNYTDEIVELGPRNHCAHQNNEYISIEDLESLYHIYLQITTEFC